MWVLVTEPGVSGRVASVLKTISSVLTKNISLVVISGFIFFLPLPILFCVSECPSLFLQSLSQWNDGKKSWVPKLSPPISGSFLNLPWYLAKILSITQRSCLGKAQQGLCPTLGTQYSSYKTQKDFESAPPILISAHTHPPPLLKKRRKSTGRWSIHGFTKAYISTSSVKNKELVNRWALWLVSRSPWWQQSQWELRDSVRQSWRLINPCVTPHCHSLPFWSSQPSSSVDNLAQCTGALINTYALFLLWADSFSQ